MKRILFCLILFAGFSINNGIKADENPVEFDPFNTNDYLKRTKLSLPPFYEALIQAVKHPAERYDEEDYYPPY